MRIAVIASSGGSAFDALAEICREQPVEWLVITDRPCGIEDVVARRNIQLQRLVDPDSRGFSAKANTAAAAWRADAALLFFARIVTAELFTQRPTFNIHPSLLPLFPGMTAVRAARAAGARLLGASLHLATAAVDQGPILAQTADAVDPGWPESVWMHLSFHQKTRLGVWLIDALKAGQIDCDPERGSVMKSPATATAALPVPILRDDRLRQTMESWANVNTSSALIARQQAS